MEQEGDTMEHDAGQGTHLSAQQNGSAPSTAGAQELPAEDAPQSAARAASASTHSAPRALPEEEERPTVEHGAWLKQDDYWKRTTYIAVTGRQTAAAPASRPLPRPKRFRKPAPVRSSLVLLLMLALIVLIPIGVFAAQRYAETHITLPSNIPGIAQPKTATPSPTRPVKPTATPKKKK